MSEISAVWCACLMPLRKVSLRRVSTIIDHFHKEVIRHNFKFLLENLNTLC